LHARPPTVRPLGGIGWLQDLDGRSTMELAKKEEIKELLKGKVTA